MAPEGVYLKLEKRKGVRDESKGKDWNNRKGKFSKSFKIR